MPMNWALALAALTGLLLPAAASAHSFGKLYNLPLPVWMYLYGAAAALTVSFLLVAYFVTERTAVQSQRTREIGDAIWVRGLRRLGLLSTLKLISVCGLLLCMATGFFGTKNSYANFNMTFFWVVFVLGFAYLTALVGDLYAVINPWRVVVEGLERFAANGCQGRFEYPRRLGYYPALLFYMVFIWIELFARTQPFSLAAMLLGYSATNLLGIWLVGKIAWFQYCEFLSVLFRLIAKGAPLEYTPDAASQRGRMRLRAPFIGLLQERAEGFSLLLFVLFMLSSTAFDGLRETVPWINLFWMHLFQQLRPYVGANISQSYPTPWTIYLGYQTLALVLSPFLYLVMYLACIGLAKAVTRSTIAMRELALRFALTLLPIALVYNITHYYTLVITQGTQIVRLVSDPFGFGWNLFGTAGWLAVPIIPDAGVVWHTQVWLILFGHIVSVYLAHLEALRVFPTRRQATLSQLPMLLLMVGFTTIGLWILSQPLGSESGV